MPNYKKTRLIIKMSLVFSFLIFACSEKKNSPITIYWEDGKATGFLIPTEYLNNNPPDSIHVQISNQPIKTFILGEYINVPEGILFKPYLPLTNGLTYRVLLSEELIYEVEFLIPHADDIPSIVALYPSSDTVPDNLLKIYIQFSRPMREGVSAEQIILIQNGKDTVTAPFLDLQPELWNKERNLLTLWLDPGRVKRDLQPNKKMGAPLQEGENYELVIKQDWQDTRGIVLKEEYRKKFWVGKRDAVSPDLKDWDFELPKAGSSDPLIIQLHEPLDFVLMKETIFIRDEKGIALPVDIKALNNENTLSATPSSPWKVGSYYIECEFRLEDLAGNNLDRLFDRDISKDEIKKDRYFKRKFEIH
jgi:hypothetical protein